VNHLIKSSELASRKLLATIMEGGRGVGVKWRRARWPAFGGEALGENLSRSRWPLEWPRCCSYLIEVQGR